MLKLQQTQYFPSSLEFVDMDGNRVYAIMKYTDGTWKGFKHSDGYYVPRTVAVCGTLAECIEYFRAIETEAEFTGKLYRHIDSRELMASSPAGTLIIRKCANGWQVIDAHQLYILFTMETITDAIRNTLEHLEPVRFVGIIDGTPFESSGRYNVKSAYYACKGAQIAYLITPAGFYVLKSGRIAERVRGFISFGKAKSEVMKYSV